MSIDLIKPDSAHVAFLRCRANGLCRALNDPIFSCYI